MLSSHNDFYLILGTPETLLYLMSYIMESIYLLVTVTSIQEISFKPILSSF